MDNKLENQQHQKLFFAHGIWSIGVKLMRNILFSTKAIIISCIFCIPICLLSLIVLLSQNEQIDIAKKEQVGVSALIHLMPIYTGIVKVRNQSRAIMGNFDAKDKYQQSRNQTDISINEFEKFIVQNGDSLKIKKDIENLKSDWVNTGNVKYGVSLDGRTDYANVLVSVDNLLVKIGDNSTLMLDPELSTFYLSEAMIRSIPRLITDIGQLWGWGVYALNDTGLSINELKLYSGWIAGSQVSINDSKTYLTRSTDADLTLKKKLDVSMFDDILLFTNLAKDIDSTNNGTSLNQEQFYTKGDAIVNRFQSFYDIGLPSLNQLLQQRIDNLNNRLIIFASFIAFTMLLAGYLFYSFYLVTRGGLNLISQHLRNIANGDLRILPHMPWGSDEPSEVIVDIRTAYASLNNLIQDISETSSNLHILSSNMEALSVDLTTDTISTATMLETQATAMKQMSISVSSSAERAKVASAFSVENALVSEKCGKVFDVVSKTMSEIQVSSIKINDIISVIDEIAFQTNILALNAAVEAARAGSQGLGFAVVATEVRHLAGRSAKAAKEIKLLILNSVSKVNAGSIVAVEAEKTMREVVANAKQINYVINEISISSSEQVIGLKQIDKAISQLDKNTQHNIDLISNTSSSATKLKNYAVNLHEQLYKFQLNNCQTNNESRK